MREYPLQEFNVDCEELHLIRELLVRHLESGTSPDDSDYRATKRALKKANECIGPDFPQRPLKDRRAKAAKAGK